MKKDKIKEKKSVRFTMEDDEIEGGGVDELEYDANNDNKGKIDEDEEY